MRKVLLDSIYDDLNLIEHDISLDLGLDLAIAYEKIGCLEEAYRGALEYLIRCNSVRVTAFERLQEFGPKITKILENRGVQQLARDLDQKTLALLKSKWRKRKEYRLKPNNYILSLEEREELVVFAAEGCLPKSIWKASRLIKESGRVQGYLENGSLKKANNKFNEILNHLVDHPSLEESSYLRNTVSLVIMEVSDKLDWRDVEAILPLICSLPDIVEFDITFKAAKVSELYDDLFDANSRKDVLRFLNSFRFRESEYNCLVDDLAFEAYQRGRLDVANYLSLKSTSPQIAFWSATSNLLHTDKKNYKYAKVKSFFDRNRNYFLS